MISVLLELMDLARKRRDERSQLAVRIKEIIKWVIIPKKRPLLGTIRTLQKWIQERHNFYKVNPLKKVQSA